MDFLQIKQTAPYLILEDYTENTAICAHGIVFSKAVRVLSVSAPPDTELVNLISPNQLSQ